MRIVDILNNGESMLNNANVVNAFYETRMLLEYTLSKSKEWIMVHINDEVNEESEVLFNSLIKKRTEGFPMQYIIGSCWFMGNEFFVNEDVLIPRADTEVWVEKIIEFARLNKSKNILDLCTGSGCIAVSLKKALDNVEVCAVDISELAIKVAEKNANNNDVNVKFYKSDLFEGLENMKFDIIVSNPPYIPNKDIEGLDKEVLKEPYIALAGGEDGLDFYRRIARSAGKFLEDRGLLGLEFGYDQSVQVIDILKENGFEILEIVKDYSGNTRAVLSRKGRDNE